MELLPLFHNLQGAPALLVGGGRRALRKARLLSRAGAVITVVAPEIEEELRVLLDESGGRWVQAKYRRTFMEGGMDGAAASATANATERAARPRLAVAATSDAAVNRAVADDAKALAVPVNVVDQLELCTAVFPAIVDRSPLIVAVGSGGRSPVLARLARAKIEALLPAAYGRLAAFAGRFRESVKNALPGTGAGPGARDGAGTKKGEGGRADGGAGNDRRRFWEDILDGPVGAMVLAGREDEAAARLQSQLAEITSNKSLQDPTRGEVYLVGAGPGDPDLLTFKALRCLQRADAVLYDRLVTPEILNLARRDAERIYVGKRRAEQALPQGDINQLLLELARQGKCVARLKGGDPFIFGRGGEEIAHLAEHKIPFQVIPGITAANGCACYAGIPLTHRDLAHSARFLAGQLAGNGGQSSVPGKGESGGGGNDGGLGGEGGGPGGEGERGVGAQLPWAELARPGETLVFYMASQELPTICRELQAHGRSPTTPAALIAQGTTPNQHTLVGTLASLPSLAAATPIHPPTTLIIGEVVALRDTLAWYGEDSESRPWPPQSLPP